MVIELDQKTEARVKQIAESTGKSVAEIIEFAIERLTKEQPSTHTREKLTPEERAAMLARIDEIRALPLEGPDDGFRVEDHDKVIYRIDW